MMLIKMISMNLFVLMMMVIDVMTVHQDYMQQVLLALM